MAEKKLKVGIKWEATDYRGTNERLVLKHLPIYKGDIQAGVCECFAPEEIFYKARIFMKMAANIERDFPDKASAKAWVEQQFVLTEDRSQELEEELAHYKRAVWCGLHPGC